LVNAIFVFSPASNTVTDQMSGSIHVSYAPVDDTRGFPKRAKESGAGKQNHLPVFFR
jgi:hypothetical protein